MAKRGAITDMGRHKPLGSSWQSVEARGYSHAYQPETRPEFQCYVTGQAKAMAEEYERKVISDGWQKVFDMLGKA